MEEKYLHRCFLLSVVFCLTTVLVLIGCDADITRPDVEAAAGIEDAEINARIASYPERYTCNGSWVNVTPASPNCHAFAWQCDYGVPTAPPNYYMGSNSIETFWRDRSFYEVSEDALQEGDKVIYSSRRHSAIVHGVSPRRFISYCMIYRKARIHRPDDPSGIYAHLYDYQFGDVSTFYHPHHTTGCSGPNNYGDPIKVRYMGPLGIEKDGWKFTAYKVNNQERSINEFRWRVWLIIPNERDPLLYSSNVRDVNCSINVQIMHKKAFTQYPNASYMQVSAMGIINNAGYLTYFNLNKDGKVIYLYGEKY